MTMKPTEEYGQSNERENYTREDRTEHLVLCSGLGGINPLKINQNAPYHPLQKKPNGFPRHKLAVLRNYDNANVRGTRNGVFLPKAKLNGDVMLMKTSSKRLTSTEPHLVKVSVYSKAVNPYIVIYDSTLKYAKPTAYLKLSSYQALPGGVRNKALDFENDNDNDCTFQLLPNKHDDVDNANVITLRATSQKQRDELVNYLNFLSMGKNSSGYKRGSSVLPTLLEEEGIEEDSKSGAENYRKLTPQNRRVRRRGSLNSLGMRLRSFNYSGK